MKELNINQAFEGVYPASRPIFKLSEKQLQKIGQVSGVVLAVIASVGVVALSAVAPNIFSAVGSLSKSFKGGKDWTKNERKTKVRRAFYYLKRSGMIKLNGKGAEAKVELTKKGQAQMEKLHWKARLIPVKAKWDGHWWLVAADIPTNDYRWAADMFRKKLKDLGFYTLQRTLWFYPFDPSSEIQFIAESFGIQKYITLMEVSRMDTNDESRLQDFFRQAKVI